MKEKLTNHCETSLESHENIFYYKVNDDFHFFIEDITMKSIFTENNIETQLILKSNPRPRPIIQIMGNKKLESFEKSSQKLEIKLK